MKLIRLKTVKQRILHVAILGLLLSGVGSLASITSVSAAMKCTDIKTSILRCDSAGGNPIINLFLEIVNFLAVGVGILVVGGIVFGGIVIVRSNGNASAMQQGVTIIVNAVIGLLLFIFMYAIINFLVPGGLFT